MAQPANPPNKINAIKDLHAQINADPNVRANFLKDPVTMLQNCGVNMSEAAKNDIKALASDLNSKICPSCGSIEGVNDPKYW